MKPVLAFVILLLPVSGCVDGEQPVGDEPPSCDDGYYVGCDGNPDAEYMLETYGLHQFTNTSSSIHPRLSSGMVAWLGGGFGKPGVDRVFDISDQKHFRQLVPDNTIPHLLLPAKGVIVQGETPVPGNQSDGAQAQYYNETKTIVWDPKLTSRNVVDTPTDTPLIPWGFDGDWVLYRLRADNRSEEDGASAINIQTKDYRLLHPILPDDSSYYGGPLVGKTVGGGQAYLSMRTEKPGEVYSEIVQVDLDSGEESVIANLTGQTVLDSSMDASSDYLVLTARMNGESGVWVWNRHTEAWTNVKRDPDSRVVIPHVGGDWVAYVEETFETGNMQNRLVAVHVPSLQSFELLPPQKDFAYGDLDTDGDFVVVKLANSLSISRKLAFDGSQLYWMELPVVDAGS